MESGRGIGPGDGVAEFPLAKGLFRTRDGPFGAGVLIVVVAGASSLLFRVDVAHHAGEYGKCGVIRWAGLQNQKFQIIVKYAQ